MAAWPEFKTQGMWSENNICVAYDLNLTNESFLRTLLSENSIDTGNPGKLIWRLFKKYGLDFIDKLRGAYAFAVWTGSDLIVVTDCFGIRPVVYTKSERHFIVASRIRHLLLDETVSRQIDPEAIYHYLFFQAVCSPVSIYKSVNKLEPGKGLKFSGNCLTSFVHYDIKYRPVKNRSESYWTQTIPNEVEKAVQASVLERSHDNIGCFLSGGTDSSSVAGYYSKFSKNPVKTFSIGFAEPKFNELDFARIAVARFGTEQHEYCVTPKDVIELMDLLPQIYDEPFGNASVFPAYYCARLARENGINILLGGDGGDEIFGGNERYVTNLIFEKYFSLPRFIRSAILEPALSSLPSIGLIYKAKQYVRRANMKNPQRFYSYNLLAENDPNLIFRKSFLEMIDFNCFMKLAEKLYSSDSHAHDTDRLLYIDMKFTITDNDLRKVTQMVEAAGIQVQYPLLDKDLVDFTTTIPPCLKVKWGKNRYIFKKAMQGFLPDKIINKSKHGMGLPISLWFKTNKQLSEVLYDKLFSANCRIRDYISDNFLSEIKKAFETNQTSYYGDNLWVFLILEDWLSSVGMK